LNETTFKIPKLIYAKQKNDEIKQHFTIIITLLLINQIAYSQKYQQEALSLYEKVQERFYDKTQNSIRMSIPLNESFRIYGVCVA